MPKQPAQGKQPQLPGPEPVLQRVFDFSGGINTRLVNSMLRDNELLDVENGFFDVVGAIKKRGGSVLFTNIPFASPVIAIYRYYTADNHKYFLWALADGHIGWVTDDGLTVTILGLVSPSNFGFFTTALNTAIFTNGVDKPWAITQTVPGTLAIATLDPSAPVALYSYFHKGRLFLAGDPSFPSKLYFSDSGAFTFSPTNTIDISRDDGSQIRQILVQFDLLIIYKDTKIFSLSGDNTQNFQLQLLVANCGLIAPKSLQDMNGIHFFLGRQGSRLGIYTLINGIVTRVSQNIDPSLQNATLSEIFNAAAFVDLPYYHLSIPFNGTLTNNLVFSFDASINAFVRFTNWNPNCITSWPGGSDLGFMFYGDSLPTGNIIQMFVGFQDQGSNYNFNVITKYYDFQFQELVKFLHHFYLTKESVWTRPPATISYDLDFAGTYANPITLSADGWAVLPLLAQGQFVSFKFHDFSSNFVKLAGFAVTGEKWVIRPR
jgi:hypothetical protein